MGGVRAHIVLIGLLAAACSATSSSPVPGTSRTPTALPAHGAQAQAFTADPSAMRGHGELAVVSGGELYLLGQGVAGVRKVAIAGRVRQPVWSRDRRWLAVVAQPPPPKSNPYADKPAAVLVVSPRGKVVRRATPVGAHDPTATWLGRTDRLAVTFTLHRRTYASVVPVRGKSTRVARAFDMFGLASPDGRSIAVGLNRFVRPPSATSWRSRIEVFSAAGSLLQTVAEDRGGVYRVAGWWPDGSGVLAWIDPMGSGSIAADGLRLYAFGIDGRKRYLGAGLRYGAWLAVSKARDEVAFIAGGDRELTLGHKHLVICSRATCHSIAQARDEVSFDPAWSATGRLAFVRDRAVSTRNGFAMSYVYRVQASGGVVVRSRSGLLRPLPAAAGSSAPVWGSDGSMLVVRGRSLYLLDRGLRNAVRVAGPIDVSANAYYGFVPWAESFAWSDAAQA